MSASPRSRPPSEPDRSAGRAFVDAIVVGFRSGLEVSVIGGGRETVTMQLAGELDLANADLVPALIAGQVRQGCRRLRLDLSRLSFCDGAGLRSVVRGRQLLRRRSGSLVLTGVSKPVSRALMLTRLDEELPIVEGAGPCQARLLVRGVGRRSRPAGGRHGQEGRCRRRGSC
jgi:anti-anti-sigma factor